jgi:hypothetical protein
VQAEDAALYDGITGQVAVSRYVLRIGNPSGAAVREASKAERPHVHPRSAPVLLRPRSIRGLLDRQAELAAAISGLDGGLPVEVTGEAGAGKTAFLRHLAHHPRAASFKDGIVYLSARHQSPADVLQLVFEAFYDSEETCKPTEADIRRTLQNKQALILLDDVQMAQHDLEHVLDVAPQSAFVVATRKRCLWGEVRAVPLQALPADCAVQLLEREMERPLGAAERAAAEALCAELGGDPLRIMQAAALARDTSESLDAWAGGMSPAALVRRLTESIDDKQRRVLLALTALPGVPLPVPHVSGIADVPDIEPSVMTLVRRGLVLASQSRYRLADGVSDQLRRTEDPKPSVNRAITYFTAWAERYRRSPDTLVLESEALLRAQQCAIDFRRWGEAFRIGRLLEGALVLGARWGAWETALEGCLAAARGAGDRSGEAWALHELGTRALCVGESARARSLLGQALKLRGAMEENDAAAITRQNLDFVLAPVSHAPTPASARFDDARFPDTFVDSLPLRDVVHPAIRIGRSDGSLAGPVTVALLAIACAVTYSLPAVRQSFPSWSVTGTSSLMTAPPAAAPVAASQPEVAGDIPPGPEPEAARSEAPLPSILIFSPRPGSIAGRAPTQLCYAVSGASEARIEPGVGEVDPTSTLTCLRVLPRRTTTYELTASGGDGHRVSQQLVIIVR